MVRMFEEALKLVMITLFIILFIVIISQATLDRMLPNTLHFSPLLVCPPQCPPAIIMWSVHLVFCMPWLLLLLGSHSVTLVSICYYSTHDLRCTNPLLIFNCLWITSILVFYNLYGSLHFAAYYTKHFLSIPLYTLLSVSQILLWGAKILTCTD